MKPRMPAPQDGVYAVIFAVLLVLLLSLVGLALDTGQVYARHTYVKHYADAAALAAAQELDGTVGGVGLALSEAESAATRLAALHGDEAVWNDAALRFATSADGPWQTRAEAEALAEDELLRLRFARVDASEFAPEVMEITRFFAPPEAVALPKLGGIAIAGPTMMQMMPLAVCAMSEDRTSARPVPGMAGTSELVEYGFRRGVTYNLLDMHPAGVGGVQSFVVNPIEFPDAGAGTSDDASFEHDALAPFVCSGAILQPKSNRVFVRSPFPADLFPELNSRFELASSCNPGGTLPDKNIKEYMDVSWLNNTPTVPYAAARDFGGKRQTIADIEGAAGTVTPQRTRDAYGALWAYARPVKYDATAAGHAGDKFVRADVTSLYPVDNGSTNNLVHNNSWSNSNPRAYLHRLAGNWVAPSGRALPYRRILNVPLLQCPVSDDEATVLAIGKFMLTSRAENGAIPGEFGGLLPAAAPAIMVRLYQ
ncbi:MAG TPA: pilus assembly protein TadG-related protein [Telluria sp.]|nr:pilus assembly protein TadG-related protein [Telluria sp.]